MADMWKLYYHGPKVVGPGRGEFVRLIFEELGMEFKEVSEGMYELSKLEGYPTLAPPMIKQGDFQLSQTGVIMKYLGKKYGLYPDNEIDEWHAEQVTASIMDYIAEGRLAFHGKNFYESYYKQQEETKPYIKVFTEKRLPKFLDHFEAVLNANEGGKGFLFGKKLTYVDLALLHVLRATEAQFPDVWPNVENIPLLRAFKDRISARPNLAAYFKSDRPRPFEGNSMM